MNGPKQLIVFCEGQTEQGFCNQVLRPHLFPQGTGILHTLAVGSKHHRHVYGLATKYEKVRRFILNTIKQRAAPGVLFTTMFDLYGLPKDFPGKQDHQRNSENPIPYVEALEQAFADDISYHGFVPYLQLHEYEALLFTDPTAFEISFEHCEAEIEQLQAIAATAETVEHIDDGRETAPSKRIIAELPAYTRV